MADDIFEAVIKDHAIIRGLMQALEDCEDTTEGRSGIFQALGKQLIAHAKAEERSLYDSMMGESASADEKLHIAEHDAIVELIRTLGGQDPISAGWTDSFIRLRTLVSRHLDEEEHELFPIGQHLLSAQQKERLGKLYRAAKADEDSKDRSDILFTKRA